MPYPRLDRTRVRMKPLAARDNKVFIERDSIHPDASPGELSADQNALLDELVERIVRARGEDRPVMLTFGAHAIKNGLGPVMIELMERRWVTHLATNGAGVIHDWEFAFQGCSSEDVRGNVARGEFGNWEETGFTINLAINLGAYEDKGYGEAVGAMIENEGLTIPSRDELEDEVRRTLREQPSQAAAAAELISVIEHFDLPPGRRAIPHPWKRYSVQAAAFRLGIPFTSHPMIGHDIIYNHPMNNGACLGRAALRDFLTFADSVSRIDGGVYLSIGSAVMSPMVFEKSFSMAQNLAIQAGRHIDRHTIFIVDLAASEWDWTQGEPPETSPDYYLRYNKTFHRMGGTMRYLRADNRDVLPALIQRLPPGNA